MSSSSAIRRRLIRQFISGGPVVSQHQLADMLDEAGHPVTQATISRDLGILGAVKSRGGGDAQYMIPDDHRFAFDKRSTAVTRTMTEWVEAIDHSGNLVVLSTPPGAAHLVASAIDGAMFSGVLGTIAGDDTVLVVAAERIGGARLALDLERIGGG